MLPVCNIITQEHYINLVQAVEKIKELTFVRMYCPLTL